MVKSIAIHGLKLNDNSKPYFEKILECIGKENISIKFSPNFSAQNQDLINGFGETITEIDSELNAVLSLGGDGTFLETVHWVEKSTVPILGINMGRLGFLASISKEFIKEALKLFFQGKYEIENRTMLALSSHPNHFGGVPYALNECALLRKDSSSMMWVKCYINGNYLNTYFADGIMVSTPTGSTGYSLSCGGPLMMPDSKDLVITPVSPHNLNVRPLIVSDSSELVFEVKSRSDNFLISLDSRSETIHDNEQVCVRKADFKTKFIRIDGVNFPDTIRKKLGWGFDQRN